MSSKKKNKSETSLDASAIGLRLRAERKKRGLSQQDIAIAIGLTSAVAVSHFEAGQIPSARMLVKYAALFETSVDWILTGETSGEIKFRVGEVPTAYGKELDRGDRTIIDELVEFLGEASDHNKAQMRNQIQLLLFADRWKKVKKEE